MRFVKKTVILSKIETTAGTDAVPTGAANAIQVANMSVSPVEANMIPINVVSAWFGASFELVGTTYVKGSFEVLAAGSGTPATAPAWGQLLLACAMSETTGLTTPARVEYLPQTDTLKTATIYYYDDGVLHKLLGVMGNVKASAKSGEAPKFTFDFIGIDGIPTATANATPTLTAWKVPPTITKANVTDFQLGCAYAAGALTGGTAYNSTGITLDWGNKVSFNPTLSQEAVVFADRDIVGAIELDLTAAQEVSFISNIKSNTLQAAGFVWGTTAGNKIMLHMPQVQFKNPKKTERNGQRFLSYDLSLWPVSGNDELRIISL